MLLILTAILGPLTAYAVAQPYGTIFSTLTAGQTADSLSQDCNATCAAIEQLEKACIVAHCGCNNAFLQAQGDCLLCQCDSDRPQDAAAVQLLLDAEIRQCHEDGVSIKFRLQIPPDSQAIVDENHLQSASLRKRQTIFLALQISGGHVGLVIVLCFAVFSRKTCRDPTFLNFCITWIFSSVIYSILLYRGTDGNTVLISLGRVGYNMCLAQGAFTNGAQVMTACSTMALVIQLWIRLRVAVRGDFLPKQKQWQWTLPVLLALPYILFFTFAIPSVFIGKATMMVEGELVQPVFPTHFYCSVIALNTFLRTVYGVTLGLLIVTVVFDILIIIILYRHWWEFRGAKTNPAISLSILLRVTTFSIYRVAVAVACGVILDRPPLPFIFRTSVRGLLFLKFGGVLSFGGIPIWADMLQAAIPLVGFFIFGLNADMINSLMFWHRGKKTLLISHTNAERLPSVRNEKTQISSFA